LFSRFHNRGGSINTAKFEGPPPQFRPAYPEGRRQGKGAGTEINNRVPVAEGKGQSRQQAAKPVEIPGKKIPEIRGKEARLPRICGAPVSPAAGKKPGKLRHIPGQGGTELFWYGQNLVHKAGKPGKDPAAFGGEGRK
jgi:hypothetical protein